MSRILSAPLSELLTSNKNNKNNNSINALHWKIFWNMQFTVGKYLKEPLVGKILAFNQHIMNSKSCLLWVVQCQSLGWNSKLKLIKQFHAQHLSVLFARRNPWFSQQNMNGTAPTQWAVEYLGWGAGLTASLLWCYSYSDILTLPYSYTFLLFLILPLKLLVCGFPAQCLLWPHPQPQSQPPEADFSISLITITQVHYVIFKAKWPSIFSIRPSWLIHDSR